MSKPDLASLEKTIEKAFEERSNYVAYLKVFPLLDPLRSD